MVAQTPSIPSDMPHLNAAFDPEMDKFLDLDQSSSLSSSASPDVRSKSSASQSSGRSSVASSQSTQTFSGPSFQYDEYKQQTGLPIGGLANTFAINEANGMQYTGYNNGFIMPMETLNVPSLGDFDFSAYSATDMDLELDSPTENSFYSAASPAKPGFVDPSALLDSGSSSSVTSGPVQRMYPGMHSQLAAQAKAQQAQKKNMAGESSGQMPQGQRRLSQNSKSQPTKDPHVEESISRLLNQMRNSSVASVDDDASTPTGNLPNLARMKRDEDDMDEDERLLASEEGKKLSSKERRQLRNKVSARAFRSRRKEYIGQLEGEVAVKTQEANDLKVQNRQLREENTRLTDLTRMLLSSTAFSGFLNELSGTIPPASTDDLKPHSQPLPQPTAKDINPHQAARHLQNQQQQIGMLTVPEQTLDFPLMENNTTTSGWNASIGVNLPIYSLHEVPQGPSLDIEELSGKRDTDRSSGAPVTAKQDRPIIDPTVSFVDQQGSSPITRSSQGNPDIELDEEAFALFTASPALPSQPPMLLARTVHHPSDAEKTSLPVRTRFHLISDDVKADEADIESRLEMMCSRLDSTAARIAAVTSHLS